MEQGTIETERKRKTAVRGFACATDRLSNECTSITLAPPDFRQRGGIDTVASLEIATIHGAHVLCTRNRTITQLTVKHET
jgi:hypothetical protein